MSEIIQGDCLEIVKTLEPKSVNCVVTSPPYWGLRDYGTSTWIGGDDNCPHMRTTKISKDTSTGHKGMFEQGNVVGDAIYKSKCPKCGAVREDSQLGLEETPEEYVENLVKLFREIRNALRDDGTVWLNLGDSYSGGHVGRNDGGVTDGKQKKVEGLENTKSHKVPSGLKAKDLVGIPWRVAFALQADGWYLRQDIIWAKPNPMPESVTDRCTKSHEYIFLLSKSKDYYYDNEAIKEPASPESRLRMMRGVSENHKNVNGAPGQTPHSLAKPRLNVRHKNLQPKGQSNHTMHENRLNSGDPVTEYRNKRDVWTVSTKPYAEAHFAVYPQKLIEPCVLAGCPEGGVVLDPFFGSGTTGFVAKKLNRNYIGIELNPEYIKIAEKRLAQGQLL